uniref:Cysteine proteinase inhibitor n=1 Tax=Hordeum vulgare subsp. vulgare TaxID=112509 RepID=A0A8I6X7G2_HORVV
MAAVFLLVLTLGHLMAAADASLHHQDARRLLAEHNSLSMKLSLSRAARVVVGPQEQPGTTAIPTDADDEPLCPCWPACC